MKITREQLRKIIIEAIMIGHDDGRPAVPSDIAYKSGIKKDKMSLGKDPGLDVLRKSPGIENQRQARALATALDFQPELTDAEQAAVEMGYYKAHDSRSDNSRTSEAYARISQMYDTAGYDENGKSNFEKYLEQEALQYIGDPYEEARSLEEQYFAEGFFDIEGIIEQEVESFLEHLAAEDPRFDMKDTTTWDDHQLYKAGRKSPGEILSKAYYSSGLVEQLEQIYDSYDFGY